MSPVPTDPTAAVLPPVLESIPASRLSIHPTRPAILRCADPAELPALLGSTPPDGIAYVQLTDLGRDLTPLADWGEGIALDLVMADPATELPLLYRATPLLPLHPLRVSVPLLPGVGKAIKLATALGCAVRLIGHQPGPEAVAELREAIDSYLHNPTVARPVEPFQGLLIAMVHGSPVDLWSLLEGDPARIRTLDDQGRPIPGLGPESTEAFRAGLLTEGCECRGCEWLGVCGGWFKWPRADYSCAEVKGVFADLSAGAGELREGLAAFDAGLDANRGDDHGR